jgi:hypothetical protein
MKGLLVALLAACALCAAAGAADPKPPPTAKVLGLALQTTDADELRYMILKPLTQRLAKERRIEATQGEKEAYVLQVQEGMKRARERAAARRDDLSRQLAASGLAPAQRDALTAELKAANSAIADLGSDAPMSADERVLHEQVATAFIVQWKINRELYRQYGGRIVFQQGGPEPLDAYRKFLEKHQARGDFRIADARLRAAFWRYYRTDSLHTFYPRGSKEESEAFAAPPWQRR